MHWHKAATLGFLFAMGSAFCTDSPVVGLWQNEAGNGAIEIRILPDGTLEGVGAAAPNAVNRKDDKNPDPALRERFLLGAKILWGFKPDNDEKSEWSGGKIYDPDNGETYSSKLKLDGTNLRIRGYIGITLFGRTTVWTRLPSASETSSKKGVTP